VTCAGVRALDVPAKLADGWMATEELADLPTVIPQPLRPT
jgi:hypothetical protein